MHKATSWTGFRIENAYAYGTAALSLQQDQSTVESANNVFSNGIIKDMGRSAFFLQGATRNTFRDVSVSNIGRSESADLIEMMWGGLMNGGVRSGPTNDNIFERITVTQTVGNYTHGALMNSISMPILRNHFVSVAWGNPSIARLDIKGAQAPLTGPGANTGLVP